MRSIHGRAFQPDGIPL
jgi:putative transposase